MGAGHHAGDDPSQPDVERLREYPAAVFADLLREAGTALDARALKQLLLDRGLDRELVDAAWRRAQPSLRRHPSVGIDPPGVYRWRAGDAAPAVGPERALERLVGERLTATERDELAGAIRAGLAELVEAARTERDELTQVLRATRAERDALEERAQDAYREAVQMRAAHQRQARVDAARALAELAMEVEELAAAGVAAQVAVERVRATVAGFGLVPIGRAGDTVAFDPAWHSPIGVAVPAGSAVLIVRPGYSWRAGDQDVLLARAQVAPA